MEKRALDELISYLVQIKNSDLPLRLHREELPIGIEPMTAVTDAILLALTTFLAAWLFARANGRRPVVLWACAFVASAVSALAGVVYHSVRVSFSYEQTVITWKIVPIATGVAALCYGAAVAIAWLRSTARRVVIAILVVKFIVCVVAAIASNAFIVVPIDFLPVLIAILVGSIVLRGQPGSRMLAYGIVVSFIGAAVQALPLLLKALGRPDPTVQLGLFDHNDIFHIIQMLATYLLYRGGVELREKPQEVVGAVPLMPSPSAAS